MEQLEGLSQGERVEMVSDVLPELKESLEDMRQISVKYNVLVNRLSGRTYHDRQLQQQNFAPVPPEVMAKYGFQIKEVLQADVFSNHIKLHEDIQVKQ